MMKKLFDELIRKNDDLCNNYKAFVLKYKINGVIKEHPNKITESI